MASFIRDESLSVDPEFANLVEELTERLQAHRDIDLDDYLKRYPQFADQLEQLIPSMEMLVWKDHGPNESRTGRPVSQTSPPLGSIEGTLGDFRIIREIGRGGMGVVFEAKQISIERRVALKILPLAELIDQRALTRFKNEVTAIATLVHPHIVSVYSIGEERGIHYYAMQLVQGKSLAVVIRQLQARSHNNESVTAEAIDQVVSDMQAEPADSAHVSSVYSSELKPVKLDETATATVAKGRTGTVKITDPKYFRNIVRLIQQAAEALQHAHEHGIVHRDVKPGNLLLDKSCNLFITDFGLARIEAVAGVTMTGDVIGTLHYMSPEQVLAGRVLVDHRTDVYSLGATLYELVTLQPLWSSHDKAELIRKISFEEPVRPQKINPAIPTDLETVILKAITKDPSDRYDSARSFSEDLHRFLDNKLVAAKRPTIAKHFAKWTKRNPAAMWAAVGVLSVLATAFAISTVVVTSAYRDVAAARADEKKALDYAETKFELARGVVDDFYSNVAKTWLEGKQELSTTQRQILVKARDLYQMFADERADNFEDKIEVAWHLLFIGSIDQRLGDYESALSSFESAKKIASELAKTYPDRQKVSDLLYFTESSIGLVSMELGLSENAKLALDTASAMLTSEKDDSGKSPSSRDYLAILASMTEASYHQDPKDAIAGLLEVERKLEELQMAISDEQLAIVKERSEYDQPFLVLKVDIKSAIGEKMFVQGQIAEAVKFFNESLELSEQLLKYSPEDSEALETSAMLHYQLGVCFRFSDRRVNALLMQETAIQLINRSRPEIPADPEKPGVYPVFPEILAWTLMESSDLLVTMEEYSLAEVRFHQLFEAINDYAQQYPAIAERNGPPVHWPQFVAECRTKYGLLLFANKEFENAGEQFHLAIKSQPGFAQAHYLLASVQQENGEQSVNVDNYREIARLGEESIPTWETYQRGWVWDSHAFPTGHIELRFLVSAAYARIEQWDDANQWYQEAMTILSAYPYPSQANPFWQQEAEKLLDQK